MHSFVILDFVIGELFCNSVITFLCIAKGAIFEQTVFNNLLHTEVSSQSFYRYCFFLQILSTKPQDYSSLSYAYI